MAEGVRFENPRAIENRVPELDSSFQSQSLTEESKAEEKLIKYDGGQ